MNNLFSIFDPHTSPSLSLNWLSSMVLLTVIPSSFWVSKSSSQTLMRNLVKAVDGEMKAVLGSFSSLGSSIIPLTLFLFILMNNILGLAPYVFTSTAHLTAAFSLSLPIWVGHMMYAWASSPNNMLAHLVPLGTPGALMPFMVLIEMISNIIRPLTLSVRLAANMVAGHLLLTLLSSSCSLVNYPTLLLLLTALILLSVLESAVAVIQAYVFSILSTLYVSEVDASSFIK